MMQKICIAFMVAFIMTGILTVCYACFGNNTAEAATEKRFVLVSEEGVFDIYYDKETLVMYAVSDGYYNLGNLSVLVDQEGKPLLYKGGK